LSGEQSTGEGEAAPERIADLAAFFLAAAAPLGALMAVLRLRGRLDDDDIAAVERMATAAVRDRLLRGGREDLAEPLAAEVGRWIALAREGSLPEP
jgi:hypothetical protein